MPTTAEKIAIASAAAAGVGTTIAATKAAYNAVVTHRPLSASKYLQQGKTTLEEAKKTIHQRYTEDPSIPEDFIMSASAIGQFRKDHIEPLDKMGQDLEVKTKATLGPVSALWPAYNYRSMCNDTLVKARDASDKDLDIRREETQQRRLAAQQQQLEANPTTAQQEGGSSPVPSLAKVSNPAKAPSHEGRSQPTASSWYPSPADKGKGKGPNPGGRPSSGITTRDASATVAHVQEGRLHSDHYSAPVGHYENGSRAVVSGGLSLPMYYKGQVPDAGYGYAPQNNVNWNSNTYQGGQSHAYPPGGYYPAQESHNPPPAIGPPRSHVQPTVGSQAHSPPMYYNGRAPDAGRETHQPYENEEDQVGPLQGEASRSQVSGNHSAMAGRAYHGPTTRMGQGRSTSVDSASSYATAKSYHSTRTTKGNRS